MKRRFSPMGCLGVFAVMFYLMLTVTGLYLLLDYPYFSAQWWIGVVLAMGLPVSILLTSVVETVYNLVFPK